MNKGRDDNDEGNGESTEKNAAMPLELCLSFYSLVLTFDRDGARASSFNRVR